MSGRSLSVAGLIVVVAGCSNVKTEVKVQESADLVEQRTGAKPEWKAPWDESSPAWSDETVLRLDEAVATALRNNRQLRADLQMIGQANADLLQAGLLQNPVINFMIMFPDGGGRSMLRANGLPTMPLQDLWLIPARREVAKAQLQQAVLRVADNAVNVAAEVKKVYARVQYTQRAMELIRGNMELVQQSTDVIRVRQTAGQATQVEVNLSRIRYLRLRSELMTMEAEHRTAQRELLMLMGLAGATDRWQVDRIDETTIDPTIATDETSLVALGSEQRLDLKAAEWQAQAAERDISLAHRQGWPDFALGLGLERSPAPPSNNQSWAGRGANYAAQAVVNEAYGMPAGAPMVKPFEPKMREVKWTVGPMFDLELPIFDWNQAGIARARSMYSQRVAEYEQRLQELTRMVRDRFVMARQAHEQVTFYRDSILPAVQQNLELARRSFIAGQESLTVYLEVQEDLLMTRLKVLEFYRDYLVSRADLEREVGGRLPDELEAATQPASSPAE